MIWLKPLFEIYKWVVDLPQNKIIYFLFSLAVTFLLFENYKLKGDNDRYISRIDHANHRNDSIQSICQERIRDCEKQSFKLVQETSLFFTKKYDEMEKRLYKEYEKVNEIKRR